MLFKASALGGLIGSAAILAGAPAADFARDVEPLFRTRCYLCHGAQAQMNGLRLDQGFPSKAIVPGKSGESRLMERVEGRGGVPVMPPTGARLTTAEIATLRTWIDEGAAWPASRARSGLWSFQPVERVPLAAVKDTAWVRNGIDHFVLAKLESEGIRPSPEADLRTLVRRVSLDLTGLPPSPAETAEFLNDKQPGAYERLVDRLLASPHYGERWARPWLDLARYADSDGYEKDLVRPYAWRYRNWVIDALNRDMPYDRFTIEQIAGDLLPGASVEQRVATGFHRNTLTNREAGSSQDEIRFEQLVDRTNTVSTAWLGLTMGCAQCHNHKYDPITQKDFYQLMAYFRPAEEENIDAPLAGEMGPYLRALPEYNRKRQELLDASGVPAFQAEWERNIRETFAGPGKRLDWDFAVTSMTAMLDGARKILETAPESRTRQQAARLTDYFVSSPGPANAKDAEVTKKLREVRTKLQDLAAKFPALSQAQVLAENPAPPKNFLYLKGDYRNPGPEVRPATLESLPALAPSAGEPPRLTLARWLVSRGNPLTARVAVNRMWNEFFGRGIVKTVEDFGTQGDRPTHPELLDYLAAEFMDRGWSMKALHRMIVTSAAYRQSSHVRPELRGRDPDNALLARQARLRLSAELLRDEALAVGGLLNESIGGRSVRPPQPKGVVELTYGSAKYVESEGAERYRRGLYVHFQRTSPHPQLMNFDAPDSHVACTRRRRSNTSLQALNLLNDPVFLEAAQALAERTLRESPATDFTSRIRYAYGLCLTREPGPKEVETLLSYFQTQERILAGDDKSRVALYPLRPESAAWAGVASVLLNLDEFITRE
jgi:cytochrome c553